MNNIKNSFKAIKKLTSVFSKNEIILWRSSAAVTLISFFIFDRQSYLTLAARLKNPYNGSRSEVKIDSLKKKDGVFG